MKIKKSIVVIFNPDRMAPHTGVMLANEADSPLSCNHFNTMLDIKSNAMAFSDILMYFDLRNTLIIIYVSITFFAFTLFKIHLRTKCIFNIC